MGNSDDTQKMKSEMKTIKQSIVEYYSTIYLSIYIIDTICVSTIQYSIVFYKIQYCKREYRMCVGRWSESNLRVEEGYHEDVAYKLRPGMLKRCLL